MYRKNLQNGFKTNKSQFINYFITSKNLVLIFLLISFLTLQGCAATTAVVGEKDTDISILQKGDSKGAVQAKIGHKPKKTVKKDEKEIEIYKIETGNEPSPGRAVGHLALDLVTGGLWELAGIPIELLTGDTYYVTVYYKNGILENYTLGDKIPDEFK